MNRGKNLYESKAINKQKKQVSYDRGYTWENVAPPEYQMGSSAQTQSEDCGYVPPHDYNQDYLTFVAREDRVSFGFSFGNMQGFELYYSLDDGSTWNIFEDQEDNAVTINKGEKILWKG